MGDSGFSISHTVDGDFSIAVITGQIDSNNATEIASGLRDVAARASRGLVVDLAALSYLTSAGFRVLLIVQDEVEEKGASLALCNLNETVRDLFDMGGLSDVFAIFNSLEDARAQI